MKKVSLLVISILSNFGFLLSQNVNDSLVLFSDLKYHSEFEKNALNNFVNQKKDTFDLFLAIDKNIQSEEADKYYLTYIQLYDQLNEEKINSKPINKKIKLAYSAVHDRFLEKYNDNVLFPEIFQTGIYNCVTATMIYSLVFDKLKIPNKVMASSSHVYLIASPGSNSVVIETTNPGFEKAIFTGEFKQQYVNYLRESKLISESDVKNKSVEEIFETKFNEVKEAEFNNLPGFQYYNKGLFNLQNNNNEEAVQLLQKAYFFFPDQQVKSILNTALILEISTSNFDQLSDIDYLAQLSRFENTEVNVIVGMFNNIISHYLQYTDKEEYCNAMFQRLSSQITNKTILEELSFSYFMQMSYRYQNTNKIEYYIENALKLKGNHIDANQIMEIYLRKKLNGIKDSYSLIDTINKLENKYTYEAVLPIFMEFKQIAYLKITYDSYNANNARTGDVYIKKFEEIFKPPVESDFLEYWIENAYRSATLYWYRKNDKKKAINTVNRGLEYIPNSNLIEVSKSLK